ncbi:MAG TPA: chloride channel protein [Bryobacteraceae bacterium]|jgi:CIC family chloride channel protein
MSSSSTGLTKLLGPLQSRLARIDLREHEDKILLLLALVISSLVGLLVVAFVALTERLGSLLLSSGGIARLLSPLIGSLIGGWLLFKFFPDARGSGIPQTRVALILNNGIISLRTIVGKFICSAISLGSGVALGREGPSVQIGAGIASTFGRRLGLSSLHVRSLVPVGTAAAVAAAFNTPLAAVLFTLEEILADLHARVVGSVVIGAATSWIVLRLILGDEPLFHVPAYQLVHPVEFLIYAILGILGGLVSTAFVKLLLWQREFFLKVPKAWKPFAPAAGGLLVGLMALFAPGVLGVGYNLVGDALNGQMALKMMVLLMVLKLIGTATCYSSGNAGGIFGPSLFIGAMLGGAVGQTAHTLFPDYTGNAGAYALVGMGAAFAGIVRTPMTSVIMIFEVTRDYTIIVPLMIANMVSYVLAKRLQKLPIYEALSKQEGITLPSHSQLEPLAVGRAMRPLADASGELPSSPFAYPDDPLDSALQRIAKAGVNEIAVIRRDGGIRVGVLSEQDAIEAYKASALKQVEAPSVQSWLPALLAIIVAAVLIVSGLVFLQRSRQLGQGIAAYENGQKLLAQGQTEAAVSAFRNALAHNSQNVKARAALGLALVESGHPAEAADYLNEVIKKDIHNGPVWSGLAEVALASNDNKTALANFRQALSEDWPAADEPERRKIQLEYAMMLATGGRKNEAVSLLLAMVDQHGDDAASATRAADAVKAIGTLEQAEEAYSGLVNHFPADTAAWIRLGDVRFAEDKAQPALDAYRRALKISPVNQEARAAVARSEEVLSLDPMRRGLPVRERAHRWDQVLDRVITAATACGSSSPDIEKAKLLAKKPAASIDAADQKMASALSVWKSVPENCRIDLALVHILGKLSE